MITPQIEIEDLIKILPESVEYMMNKGIRCLRCGEPIWGTLENAAIEKGFSGSEINSFVTELNGILESKSN